MHQKISSGGLRVCLIGTSNSIYKDGYAGALQDDARVSTFVKYSMGASPSVIIPYFGSTIDFSQFDCVIFETAINDRNYHKYGSIGKDQIRRFLEWGIRAATEAGCHVALLVMPARKDMDRQTIPGIIYQRIAVRTGATFLNGFDFIRTFASATERPLDSLFIDNFHIRKPIAYKLGTILLDKIVADRSRTISPSDNRDTYRRIEAAALSPDALLRQNSLLSARFVALDRSSGPVQIKLLPGEAIIGLAYNAARSSGRIVLSSSGEKCVKNLTTKYFGSSKDLLLIACPLRQAISAGADGLVQMRCGTDKDEPTEQSRFEGHAAKHPEQGILEIACVIVRSTVAGPSSMPGMFRSVRRQIKRLRTLVRT